MSALDSRHLCVFFAAAFGLSWTCWLAAALGGLGTGGARTLLYAGALGPGVAGVAVLMSVRGRDGWVEISRSALDFRRLNAGWVLFVVLFYPAVTAFGVLLERALTGRGPDVATASALAASPAALPAFLLWVLLLGPLPEELGWRGFALGPMQRQWGVPLASLTLGVLWAVWHLPLFLVDGTYHRRLGLATPSFWAYEVSVVALSFVFSALYNGNGRSVLAAILFHFVLNLTGSLVQSGAVTEVTRCLLLIACAALVSRGARRVLPAAS